MKLTTLPSDIHATYSSKRHLFFLKSMLQHIEMRKNEYNRPETAGIYFQLLEQEKTILDAMEVVNYHKRTFSTYPKQ